MPTPQPTPSPSRARRSGSGCSSSTSCGARRISGSPIAVDTIPPFLMAAARFFLAGADPAWPGRSRATAARSSARAGASGATARSSEHCSSAAGMGFVAFGEQTVPSGIAALLVAMMPVWVAILGGIFLGERLPRLARSSGSRSGSRVSRSSSARRRSVAAARSTRSGSPPASSPRSRGRGVRCSPRTGRPARQPARRDRPPDALGGLVLAVMAALCRRARRPSTRRPSPAIHSSRSPT